MAVTLDISGLTSAERLTLWTSVKAEFNRRISGGSIVSGSSAGQSFQMNKMNDDNFYRLFNLLSAEFGGGNSGGGDRVAPNFSGRHW